MTRPSFFAMACAAITTPSVAMSTPPVEYSRVTGPGVHIEATVWSKATVARTISLNISVRTESGVRVEWPGTLVVGNELGGMTIARVREHADTIDADGSLVSTRVFSLEPFLPGAATVGPLEFVAQDAGGERRTLVLGAMTVTVVSVLPDASVVEVTEPMGVVDLPPEEASRWGGVALGAGAALALAGVAAVVLVARRRARREPSATPSERALAALAMLEERVRGESGMGARPSSDEAYTALSTILRRYIEERFAVRTTVLTTEEFFSHDATRSALPQDATDALRPLLAACDEVKFGAFEPGLRAAGEAIDQIRAFVARFGDPTPESEGRP